MNLSPPEEMEALDFFQKLIDFIYDPVYARHLRKIAGRFDRNALPEDIDIRPFIVDFLIFETHLDKKTPIEHFITAHSNQLSKSHLHIYERFKKSHLSSFQVIDSIRPDRILLADLVDQSSYMVRDSEAIKFLWKDMHCIARLLPFGESYVLTGACAIVNSSDREQIMALMELLKPKALFV